jgi:hypothetical protein
MDMSELEQLRQQYQETVEQMDADPERAAYHFGRLEVVAERLLRLIDRSA